MKSNIEALGRFPESALGKQYLSMMRKHILGKMVEDVQYSITDTCVLVRVVVEGGMSASLAIPDLGPEWESDSPEFLSDAFSGAQTGQHEMGTPGAKEIEDKESENAEETSDG